MHQQATRPPSSPTSCENIFPDVSVWERLTQNNIHADTTSTDRKSGIHVSDFDEFSGRLRQSPMPSAAAETPAE